MMKNITHAILMAAVLMVSCEKKKQFTPEKIITIKSEVENVEGVLNLESLEKKHPFSLHKNAPFTKKITNDKKVQEFIIMVEDVVVFGYVSSKSTVYFFRDENGKLDYKFDEGSHLNNFSKLFHQTLLTAMMKGTLTAESFEKIEKNIKENYKKIKSNLNKAEQLTAQYMMRGRFTSVKMALGEKSEKNFNDDYYKFVEKSNFPEGFFKYYRDNYSVAMNMFQIALYRKGLNPEKMTVKELMVEIVNYSNNQNFRDTFIVRYSTAFIEKGDEKNKEYLLAFAKEQGISQAGYAKMKAITATNKKEVGKGDKALYFETLKPLENNDVSALKGKIVFVDNWATWCGACIENINAFIKNKVILPKNIVMAFISHDQVEKAAAKFIAKTPFPKKQVVHFYNPSGQKGDFAKYYNIKGLPNYFVIEKDGNILDMNPPHPSDEHFESYLNKIAK